MPHLLGNEKIYCINCVHVNKVELFTEFSINIILITCYSNIINLKFLLIIRLNLQKT